MITAFLRSFIIASIFAIVNAGFDKQLRSPPPTAEFTGGSLPVIVTAGVSETSVKGHHDRSHTTSARSSVVTTTNIFYTTTTVFTTIVTEPRQSTFTPTNALQVLSAAERSFSQAESSSALPQIVTEASTVAAFIHAASEAHLPSLVTRLEFSDPRSASGTLVRSIFTGPGSSEIAGSTSAMSNNASIVVVDQDGQQTHPPEQSHSSAISSVVTIPTMTSALGSPTLDHQESAAASHLRSETLLPVSITMNASTYQDRNIPTTSGSQRNASQKTSALVIAGLEFAIYLAMLQ